MRRILALTAAATLAAACGSDGVTGSSAATTSTQGRPATTAAPPTSSVPAAECADVVAASAIAGGSGTWTFSATVRSPDTGWDKYADAWEVVGPDGTVYGRRELAHPHVDEQPFTRSLAGVAVPDGVDAVTIRARDSVVGFCGETVAVEVPR
jgi:hypothetical protein